jgi:GNAT superfamily N-acetyltransferase
MLSSDMFEAEASLFTRAGDRIHVRPAASDDRQRVTEFFSQLSPEDLQNRFQIAGPADIDPARIDHLCRADYPAAMTFLAFSQDEELVALANLTGSEPSKVEVAVATLARWKQHGVSWALLGHAVNYAATQGASEIVSIERHGNRAAITLEHEMGFSIRMTDAEAGEIVATKTLR